MTTVRNGLVFDNLRRRLRLSLLPSPSAPEGPVAAYRGSSLDPNRDKTDDRLGIGDAVMCVIGASRMRRSSMLTSGLSSCSYSTSPREDDPLPIPD